MILVFKLITLITHTMKSERLPEYFVVLLQNRSDKLWCKVKS
jgi:hypothetical protein